MPAVELATHSWGIGSLRLLLVHGLSSSAAGWWRVAPDLAALGFAVTAPDLRGHGVTGPSDSEGYGIAGYTEDLLALGSGWNVALGHSLGGRLLLEAQLADPAFAEALVLVDPALHIAGDPEIVAQLSSEFDTPPEVSAFRERYPCWADEDVAAKVEAMRATDASVMSATMTALADGDHWPRLGAIAVPTLVIGAHPDQGGLVPPAVGAAAAESPHVEYVGIEGAGHSIHRDSYEAFWEALDVFLSKIGARR